MDSEKIKNEQKDYVSNEYKRVITQSLSGGGVSQEFIKKNLTQSKQSEEKKQEDYSEETTYKTGENTYHTKKSSHDRYNDIQALAQKQRQNKPEAEKINRIKENRKNAYKNYGKDRQIVKNRRQVRKDNRGLNRLIDENKSSMKKVKLEYSRWLTVDRLESAKRRKLKESYFDRGINKRTTTYAEVRTRRRIILAHVTYRAGDNVTINTNLTHEYTKRMIVRTHRVILPDKKKVYSLRKYNRLFNPTLTQDITKNTKQFFKDSSGMCWEGAKNKGLDKLRREGGTGGEMVSAIGEAPTKLQSGIRLARGVVSAPEKITRLTYNSGKVAMQGTYMTGKLMVKGTRYVRDNGIRKTAEKMAKETAAKLREQAVKSAKLVIKITQEAVKKAVSTILPLALVILFFVIFVSLIIGVLGSSQGRNSEAYLVSDSNAILATQDYMNELVEEWEKKWKEEKKNIAEDYELDIEFDDNFEVVTKEDVCPYGNIDSVNLLTLCDEEEAKINGEYIAMYSALCAKYEYEVNNIGVDRGNEYELNYPSADILKIDLSNWFYYLYPLDRNEMLIELEELNCEECENSHQYKKVTVTIVFRTVTELLANLGFNDEQLDIYITVHSDLMAELKNGTLEWTAHHTNTSSIYDDMTQEEWLQLYQNAPSTGVTREEFINYAVSQHFNYQYGSKNPSSGSLDCSGFTSYIYKQYGIEIGEGTAMQFENTRAISPSDAKAGDLVFKQDPTSNGINHVGIYLEDYADGRYVHCASSTGTVVNNYKGFVIFRRPLCRFEE